MLSSPRRPVRTMRIFSSAENWRRVTPRISFTTCPAGSFPGPDFCPICAPSMATMGQKSSLPQPAPSVSSALMPDRLDPSALGRLIRHDDHAGGGEHAADPVADRDLGAGDLGGDGAAH